MEGTARKGPIALAFALFITALAPAAAAAHEIVSGPSVSGVPQEGQTLTAKAEWKGKVTKVAWRWQRCTAGTDRTCTVIEGATEGTYVLTPADVGFAMRVRLTITADHGNVSKRSKPTSAVQPADAPPPPPEETGEPEPEPGDPWGDPADPDPFDPPVAKPGDPPPPPAAAHLTLMKPFPVVRISGRLTAAGAEITRFAVRSPRGASVKVRCRGRSCPVRRFARTAALGRLRKFERHLSAGTRLHVVVRKPAQIGKWTTITIRRGSPPRRVDRCSYPGRDKPATCPAA